jgi:hypothetical protein
MADMRGDMRDPDRRLPEERSSNAMIGWAAGAVFIVLVLLFVFGVGRDGSQTAGNNPPAATTGQSTNTPASRPATPPATTGQSTTSPGTTGQGQGAR